jgi:hypothetical protein
MFVENKKIVQSVARSEISFTFSVIVESTIIKMVIKSLFKMCIELINKNTIRHSTVFCNRLMSRRDVSTFFLFFKLNVAIK